MNPCPCGHRGDGTERCTCDPGHVARYRSRVSGPLLDRIDLHLPVGAVSLPELVDAEPGEPSEAIRDRVVRARKRQLHRFRDVEGVFANGQMGVRQIRRFCGPSRKVSKLLRRAVDRLGLSARGYHRILKVARTVADLEGCEAIAAEHAAEAVQYRQTRRRALARSVS